MASFVDLDDDALISILKYFKPLELMQLSRVCKHWNNIISNCNQFWRKYIPQCQNYTLPYMENSKDLVKFFYRKSIELEGEYWCPDPYQPLVERANLLKDYHRRDPYRTQEDSEFELYARLNPIYDVIKGHHDEKQVEEDFCNESNEIEPSAELLLFIKRMFETINRHHPWNTFLDVLDSEVELWEDSYQIGAAVFLDVSTKVY